MTRHAAPCVLCRCLHIRSCDSLLHVGDATYDTPPPALPSAHEAALLRNPELAAQIEADQADPSRAVRSEGRRPRGSAGT